MDNVKDDLYYLNKIRTDLKFVIDHTAGKTIEEFSQDEVLQDSALFRIIQIAENTGKLSDSFKADHPAVPWTAIKGMRNRIVHNYGVVNLAIVYDTVIHGIPEMYQMLMELEREP